MVDIIPYGIDPDGRFRQVGNGDDIVDQAGNPLGGGPPPPDNNTQTLSFDGSTPGGQWGTLIPGIAGVGALAGTGIYESGFGVNGSPTLTFDNEGMGYGNATFRLFEPSGGSDVYIRTNQNPKATWKFTWSSGSSGSEDMFLGITDRSSTQHNAGQIPNGQYLGFFYSNAGNIRFLHSSGGAPTNVDSGVIPSEIQATYYLMRVTGNGTSVEFVVYDRAGTQIAAHTATTNLPVVTTGMKHLVTWDQGAVTGLLRFHKLQLGGAA